MRRRRKTRRARLIYSKKDAGWMQSLMVLILSPEWDRAAAAEHKAARKAMVYATEAAKRLYLDKDRVVTSDAENFVGIHLPRAIRDTINWPWPHHRPLLDAPPGWFEDLVRVYEDER